MLQRDIDTPPAFRVVDQPLRWPPGSNGTEQGATNQILRHAMAHGVANDFFVPEVLDCRQIESAFFSGDIGYISHPGLIRA